MAELIQRSTEQVSAIRAAGESWKRADEGEKDRIKKEHPELYDEWVEQQRRAEELLLEAEKQHQAIKALGTTMDRAIDLLRQQQVSLRDQAERAAAIQAAWNAAEATPFKT